MKTTVAFALAAAELAYGHATFQSFIIDGKDQGQHKGVQLPSNANNPILDVTSSSMICNGGTKADNFIEVAAGSEIGLQWHHNDGGSTAGDNDEPIAASHKGPVMVYIAPAESEGKGDVWVKLQEDGLTGTTWGVDNFIKNKGLISVKIPDLAAGEYLIRPEIIALHEGSAQGKTQFYNGCGQIKITGSGSVALSSGVDMTKAYSATEPGVKCNIYGGAVKCTKDGSEGYDVPGPAVFNGSGGSSPARPAPSAPADSAPAASSTAAAPAPEVTSGYETGNKPSKPSPTKPASQPTPTAVHNNKPGSESESGSTLPKEFTIAEFISWLETKTGSAAAKRFARALARRHPRDFA